MPNILIIACDFFAETIQSFFAGHFVQWDIWVICLIVVLKLAVTVFVSLYFQIFWPKWLNFCRSFQKILVYDRKKNRSQAVLENSFKLQSFSLRLHRHEMFFGLNLLSSSAFHHLIDLGFLLHFGLLLPPPLPLCLFLDSKKWTSTKRKAKTGGRVVHRNYFTMVCME